MNFLLFIVMPVIVYLASEGISLFVIAAAISGSIFLFSILSKYKSIRDWKRILIASAELVLSVAAQVKFVYLA